MLRFHSLPVTRVERAAEDALCITLAVPADLEADFRYEAGQYVTVRRQVEGREERRTYSIVPASDDREFRLGVRIQPDGRVSGDLAQTLKAGDRLEVGTPGGRFRTQVDPSRARRYAAFASGSGVTPVLSIASRVLSHEPSSRFALFYGNRNAARAMFLEEILALKNRSLGRFDVHFFMSQEPQAAEILNGRLDAKKVRDIVGRLFDPTAVDEYFVCGPGQMVEEVRETLRTLNADAQIHVERFTSVATGTRPVRSPAIAPSEAATATVTVTIDGRRRSFPMFASDASVLHAAERAGIALPYSCRSGICATCRVRVVEGETDMEHNVGLEPWEVAAGFTLCCQARPKGRVLALTYDEK